MNVLIAKLGATGDVVRTTPLIGKFDADITWITAAKNAPLLNGVSNRVRCLTWEERESATDRSYDLIINLEDTADVAAFLRKISANDWFGAYLTKDEALSYTENSRRWFDLSLISVFGKEKADQLKLANRSTYQELIFEGLGFRFEGDPYFLPAPTETDLQGDVAIAPEGGPVWPMKNWAYYKELTAQLEAQGLRVNVLPHRATLLEHLGDVRNHRCLVSGDSLPMHMALGTKTKCVSLFTCTGPWEICDYGVQIKITSPLLPEFFFKRGFDQRATSAISVQEVLTAVYSQLGIIA